MTFQCVEDTKALSDNVLTFIKNHPIMDSAVMHQHGKPLFYQKDLVFTKLAVVQTVAEGYEYAIFFAGTSKSKISDNFFVCRL